MKLPFDENSGETYSLQINANEIDAGDGVILTLNRKACESFAMLFSQLALASEGEHVHLGYDETEPQGPGIRIVLCDNT